MSSLISTMRESYCRRRAASSKLKVDEGYLAGIAGEEDARAKHYERGRAKPKRPAKYHLMLVVEGCLRKIDQHEQDADEHKSGLYFAERDRDLSSAEFRAIPQRSHALKIIDRLGKRVAPEEDPG
jgi:hypothetical protein